MKGTLTGRCYSCHQHHSAESMCPPHEVRTTGMALWQGYIEELENEIERLQAIVDRSGLDVSPCDKCAKKQEEIG